MQDYEDVVRCWNSGALVLIYNEGSDEAYVRPAAFVYPRGGILSWVEPGYADPFGTPGNSLHTREGQLMTASGGGIEVIEASGGRVIVRPYGEDTNKLVEALEWFANYIKGKGRTYEEEREAVRLLIADC